MHHQTPYGAGAYSAIGIETGVDATDPLGLVIMLYDGAVQAILRAEHHLANGEIEARGRYTSRAIDIVNLGLASSLDSKAGGELAESLASLYDYLSRRLVDANRGGHADIYIEVRTLLSELRGSWAALRASKPVAGAGARYVAPHVDAVERVQRIGRSLAA